MLDPNRRSLLTTLLTPPPGMVFDAGLATTFTLDPLSLLSVPVHLAWLASGEDRSLLLDGVRLLEALRRVSDRLTVYAQRGRMQAPAKGHPLYALLESTIVEVRAPRGGVFHPKLWVLRFAPPEGSGRPLLRVGVLSRNLTSDRSWDLSLQLEGTPTGRYVAANRELGELIAALPNLAAGAPDGSRREQAAALADEVRRTAFDLPSPWEELSFHVLGLSRRTWAPPASHDLAIISPFLRSDALGRLCDTTDRPQALISRPDELAALDPAVRARFERCLVLAEAAETEDGEEAERRDAVGLHAKGYLARVGWHTHLIVGSANATDAALLGSKNVELLAELRGRHTRTGRVEDLLDKVDFGGVLVDFDPETPIPTRDAAALQTERALDAAQQALADAALEVQCEAAGDDAWALHLRTSAPVPLGEAALGVWPLSLPDERAVDGRTLLVGAELALATVATADVTGLVGFELRYGDQIRRFALNLPLLGAPAEREGAIVRRVVRNREGFLRYLRLLLGDLGGELGVPQGMGDGKGTWGTGGAESMAILEDLVRAFARDRRRLEDVRRVVDRLRGDDGVVPPEFLTVWDVFAAAMGEDA